MGPRIRGQPAVAARRLDEDEVLTLTSRKGRGPKVNYVNESGLYNVLATCRQSMRSLTGFRHARRYGQESSVAREAIFLAVRNWSAA
jgi:hypothetical protein